MTWTRFRHLQPALGTARGMASRTDTVLVVASSVSRNAGGQA